MIAVRGPEEGIRESAQAFPSVSIAAFNGPHTVLSGPERETYLLMESFSRSGWNVSVLRTSHAFHSAAMDPILEDFRHFASSKQFSPLKIPLVSNLSGKLLPQGYLLDADYLAL